MKSGTITAIVMTFLAITPVEGWTCPLCNLSEGDTILTELDSARTAVLAELVRPPLSADKQNATTGYRIVEVLKAGQWGKAGDTIDLPLVIPSTVGSVHLLLEKSDKPGHWLHPRGLTASGQVFVRLAARLPLLSKNTNLEDRIHRLVFLRPYLISNDRQLARSAYAEFARAPYADIKELAPVLNHRELLSWIELEQGGSSNRRLFFTLLGVCRNSNDIGFVKSVLDDRLARGKSTELDAIIAAYITLAGVDALAEIDRRLLKPEDIPLKVRRAAVQALRFHADCETVIEKERVIASSRLLLNDPKSADFVIGDLARWKDWKSLDAILELWDKHKAQKHWLKQPIVNYLEECPLPEADLALDSIRQSDP